MKRQAIGIAVATIVILALSVATPAAATPPIEAQAPAAATPPIEAQTPAAATLPAETQTPTATTPPIEASAPTATTRPSEAETPTAATHPTEAETPTTATPPSEASAPTAATAPAETPTTTTPAGPAAPATPGPATPGPATPGPADPTGGEFRVTVSDVRSDSGVVRVAIYRSEEGFATEEGLFRSSATPAQKGSVEVVFEDLPSGPYGVAVFHDENSNDVFDMTFFGTPSEGFGFGNDAPVTLGAPSFSEAAIMVDAGTVRETVKLRYW